MKSIVICFSLLFGILSAQGQSQSSEVYAILKAKDSVLFERSFNLCETYHLNTLISEDFEFYHDKSGVTNSKADFIKIMETGICNPNNPTTSRRELVGSLEVFPLYDNGTLYGALQNGTHRFFETTNGKEIKGSIAKFSHLWILENNTWKLKRVISFDHK